MRLSRFTRILAKLGWVANPPNRSVIIAVPDLDAYADVEWLVSRMNERNTRMTVFFIAGSDAVRDAITRTFGSSALLDWPIDVRPTCLTFLLSSRTRLLIAMRDVQSLPPGLVKQAYSMGIAMTVIGARAGRGLPHSIDLSCIDWWLPSNAHERSGLIAAGVREDHIAREGTDSRPLAHAYSSTLDYLHELMARRPPDRRTLQRWVIAGFDRPLMRKLLDFRASRIESLDELKSVLGNPQTILCLGSGPSSETSALNEYRYDSLFRVNYRWRERRFFDRPDMVFTGQKRTLFSVRGAIFAFQTRRAEAHLVTHQIFNPLCRRMRFVTLERIGVLEGDNWDGVRPTNGATMLTAAVALAPKRLVIAGIDLFEDPAGPYPGDSRTPNDYVLVHERNLELQFILDTLRRYKGELVILSNVLAEKWAAALEESAPTGLKAKTID